MVKIWYQTARSQRNSTRFSLILICVHSGSSVVPNLPACNDARSLFANAFGITVGISSERYRYCLRKHEFRVLGKTFKALNQPLLDSGLSRSQVRGKTGMTRWFVGWAQTIPPFVPVHSCSLVFICGSEPSCHLIPVPCPLTPDLPIAIGIAIEPLLDSGLSRSQVRGKTGMTRWFVGWAQTIPPFVPVHSCSSVFICGSNPSLPPVSCPLTPDLPIGIAIETHCYHFGKPGFAKFRTIDQGIESTLTGFRSFPLTSSR